MINAIALLCALAQGPRDPMLVTTEWLAQHQRDPNIVLIQMGFRSTYDSSHIAGARYLPFAAIQAPRDTTGPTFELPTPAAIDSVLESLGVSDSSRIVLYQSNDWYTPVTRAYLTLFWAGLSSRTSILDGGLRAWRAGGGAVTAEMPAIRPGRVTIRPRNDAIVLPGFVLAHLDDPHVAIVDARDPYYFTGKAPANDSERRPGHLPGAYNLPFEVLLAADGRFKPTAEIAALFRSASANPGDLVISYCHIGLYGTMVWFSAKLAGYDARLYDGSFSQWSTQTNNPVETFEANR